MNWSAFFQGAPAGFSQGMDWSQRFNQNQQMNPLLLQHQQLQNQQMAQMNPLQLQHQQLQNQGLGQNISQSGTNFNREGNAYDALMRSGMTPTARPQSMPNMDNILAGPQANGPGNVFGKLGTYPQQDFNSLYSPIMPGAQQSGDQGNTPYMQNPYAPQNPMSAPWRNGGQ